MDRRSILKMCGLLGVGLPLIGCGDEAIVSSDTDFEGKVLIIGAGAAGMSAGLLLAQRGIDFELLEAAPMHGGRIKRADGFVDFPIPLGGEWLHADRDELSRIVNDESTTISTEVVGYDASTTSGYFDETLELGLWGTDSDLKFVGITWLDFFDEYVVPEIADRMTFNVQVTEIDYSGEQIIVASADDDKRETDRVIVTAPLRTLQEGSLRFVPELPAQKQIAVREATIWNGFKAFFEFSEAFYPTFLEFPDSATRAGQRLYYDAAFGQDTDTNVLGLFSVGVPSEPYSARTGDALRDYILAELDEVFDGAATLNYLQHVTQDWASEPFIEQAYISDHSSIWIPRDLWTPVDERVFFAGEAYTRHGDWGAVDDAARAARDTVARILG